MGTLNPGFKFLSIIIIGIILSFTYNVRLNMIVFAASFILVLTVRPFRPLRILLWLSPFTLAAAGLFMTGLFFAKDGPGFSGSFGVPAISVQSLEAARQLSWRVMAFGGLAMLFSLSTNPTLFFHSLGQNFKLPAKFTYGLLAAYHFLPVIKDEYLLVKASLIVRGISASPLSLKRATPMLVRSFRRSENLAMAMESRGFNPLAERSCAFPIALRARDFIFMGLAIGLPLIGLWLL
ncbi:MAG: energy-coupling factor transporter transmembrane protein EcfT [Deltaproteobacteria bacterium]|jgi:energy-coupling factor transport system permease protein|nr:energy-coupling factor transporter transmembrane protein EcfT [Deltaproteobacteria bacterium]